MLASRGKSVLGSPGHTATRGERWGQGPPRCCGQPMTARLLVGSLTEKRRGEHGVSGVGIQPLLRNLYSAMGSSFVRSLCYHTRSRHWPGCHGGKVRSHTEEFWVSNMCIVWFHLILSTTLGWALCCRPFTGEETEVQDRKATWSRVCSWRIKQVVLQAVEADMAN